MARILDFVCPKCSRAEEVLTFDAKASPESLAPACAKCKRAMAWQPSIRHFIVNSQRLNSKGIPVTSPGQDYLDVQKQDDKYREKYSPTERAKVRQTRDEHDKAVKQGRKDRKIQVSG